MLGFLSVQLRSTESLCTPLYAFTIKFNLKSESVRQVTDGITCQL